VQFWAVLNSVFQTRNPKIESPTYTVGIGSFIPNRLVWGIKMIANTPSLLRIAQTAQNCSKCFSWTPFLSSFCASFSSPHIFADDCLLGVDDELQRRSDEPMFGPRALCVCVCVRHLFSIGGYSTWADVIRWSKSRIWTTRYTHDRFSQFLSTPNPFHEFGSNKISRARSWDK